VKPDDDRLVEATMPGGRPAVGAHDSYPELAELAGWFREAIMDCGYPSINAFVVQHTLDKNRVYGVANGTQLLRLASMRELARVLQRDPAEVEPIWLRAKEAMERRLADQDDEQPYLTAWAEIPPPEPALRNLLDALTDAVDQLPYRLLGVVPPPLSTVYVRQRLRQGPTSADSDAKGRERQEARLQGSEPAIAEFPVSVAEALNRSEHLVITGEPGAGKSTLGHHLISRLARIWLRQESAADPPLAEPVVPVRVSARALAADDTWSAVLAEATRRALGPYLITEPSPQLFTHRVHGARWLIVVDGLDEILDRSTRASIIRALGRHARAGSEYRFVITTRPLPDEELALLRAGHIGHCRIEPFERDDLRFFARCWFAAQDPVTADRRAMDFLHQVEDGRLRELVRNPLLATIAAVANTREPGRPLPANRIDLYQRFYEYLVTDDEASGRATPTELRRFRETHPARYRLAEWIHAQRATLIDALAMERLTTDASLTEAASTWVAEQKPVGMECAPGWEEDVERLLIDTGMFVYESTGLRFLHHTFAEFLAARLRAEEISADFPDLDEWIGRGLDKAQQTFALLTFVLWGSRDGNDTGVVLRRLLGGGRNHLLLAGQLLAESSRISDYDSTTVVDRLVDLVLGNIPAKGDPFSDDAGRGVEQIYDVISGLGDNAHAAARFRGLLGKQELTTTTRILAAVMLGLVGERQEAIRALTTIASTTETHSEVLAIAGGLHELEADAGELIRPLALRVGRDPQADADLRTQAAEILADISEREAAIEVARTVLVDATADESDLAAAVRVLLDERSQGNAVQLTAILEQAALRLSSHRVKIAEELASSGHAAAAISMARGVLADSAADESDLANAIEVWVSAAGDAATGEIVAALEQHSANGSWPRVRLAEELAKTGNTEMAISMAREVLTDSRADAIDVGVALETWLSAGGPTVLTAILETIERRLIVGPQLWAELASTLAELGHYQAAANQARRVLNDLKATAPNIAQAIQALIESQGIGAAIEIRAALDFHRVSLNHRVVAADSLAASGALSAAAEIWTELILASGYPITDRLLAVSRLVNTGLRQQAIEALRSAILAHDLPLHLQGQLRALLAWATLSDPSAATCGLCRSSDS
jgi:NACHT domain